MPYEGQTLDIQNRKKQPKQSTRPHPEKKFHAPRIEAIRRAGRHGLSVALFLIPSKYLLADCLLTEGNKSHSGAGKTFTSIVLSRGCCRIR
jgi:hypothetical protein